MSVDRLQSTVRLSVAVVGLVAFCATSAVAATVTGVAGSIEQRQAITISGIGFGAAPTVVLFDDFENGSPGQGILTGPGSAAYGQWAARVGTPHYTSSSAVSGSLSFQADMSINWTQYVRAMLPADTRDFFISWWMYIPIGDRIPGEGTTDTTNWKTVWVMGSGTTDDDITLPTILQSSILITANGSPYTKYISLGFQKGEWKRVWVWTKGGYNNDGQCHYWELDDPNGVIQRANDNNVTLMYEGGIRERVHVNGYGRTTPDCHPGFDDVYIAAGSNARARVEIGNRPSYTNCTGLAICVPTSWSSTSIAAMVNVGGLNPADNWYLFVTDASGVTSAGYLVHPKYVLTVNSGTGDGQYLAGQVVAISADAAPSGKVFDGWVGDTAGIADAGEAGTTITMPAADTEITATYTDILHSLTVNSGTGDGSYAPGAVVAISADAAPPQMVFRQWVGETGGIADVGAASTTLTMPAGDTEVTATYKHPGDLNDDGFVGQVDLDMVLDDWGLPVPPADSRADPSGDGFVGQVDLDYVLDGWGKGVRP